MRVVAQYIAPLLIREDWETSDETHQKSPAMQGFLKADSLRRIKLFSLCR
jgi:hypothetical protein